MIYEVLTSMMLKAFFSKYPVRQIELELLQANCESKELICEEWNTTKVRADTISAAFEVYLKDRALSHLNNWNTYVSDLFPILRDLTNSLLSGNWILYLSAVERTASRMQRGTNWNVKTEYHP